MNGIIVGWLLFGLWLTLLALVLWAVLKGPILIHPSPAKLRLLSRPNLYRYRLVCSKHLKMVKGIKLIVDRSDCVVCNDITTPNDAA